MKEDILHSLEVLKKGGIILYPTDTIWGIGCDATRQDSVDKIYQIKKREDSKSLILLIDSPDRLAGYVKEIPEIAWELLVVSDQPLTIVYPRGKNLPSNVCAGDGSVGIRVTSDPFCQELIRKLGKPLISTSANISGEKTPAIFSEITESIKSSVDYIVQWRQDDLDRKSSSAVIRLSLKNEIEILRAGSDKL